MQTYQTSADAADPFEPAQPVNDYGHSVTPPPKPRAPHYDGETEKQQARSYVARWRSALYQRGGLGMTNYAVAVATAEYADHRGICWPSAKTIADKIGCDERTVRRAWKKLEAAGWIDSKERPGTSKIFKIKVPAPRAESPDTPDTEYQDPGHRVRRTSKELVHRTSKELDSSLTTSSEPEGARNGSSSQGSVGRINPPSLNGTPTVKDPRDCSAIVRNGTSPERALT